VKLTNSFRIDRPVPEVYEAFLDVERIATCMPGSKLLGEPEPGTYEGEVKVKVGPLGVAYTGQFTVLDADESSRVLRMRAKGREQRGAGNADAHIVATMHEDGDGTRVDIDTDLSIRGKVAQFGRGVIGDVTDEIMQTFARNVEQLLATGGAAEQDAESSRPQPEKGAESSRPRPSEAGEPSDPEPAAAGGELDAWSMIVRPMLQRHAGQVAQLAVAAAAAYLGARAGARAGSVDPAARRRRPHLHYY
jgi:uncharacterized protein